MKNTLHKSHDEAIQMQNIPFALPDIGKEEIEAVTQCLESGWLTTGPKVKQFESDFAEFIGSGVQAISVNSATAGLMLALEAVGVGAGDEVITTPYTFSATAMVCVHLGATPVLVDINPATFNIDPAQIESAITSKTKAIIPVHFAGLACDMESIIKIARRHNLKIIEDAAHALPATCDWKLVGSLDTDATVYSFYATKTITTGEGGMIVTKNKDIAQRCRTMRLHGISKDVFDRYTSMKSNWYYEIIAAGFKVNMTDIAAAIGIGQLKKANNFQKIREGIKDRYFESFKDLPITLPPDAPKGETHSWHLFVIRLNDNAPIGREEFITTMAEKYKIGCSVHFIPLHLHPYWQQKLDLNAESFPLSKQAFERAISLPIYTKMSEDDIARVIFATKELLKV